jgi:uncharacterized protein (DUF2267 family)
MPHGSPIDQSVEKAHIWVNEVAAALETEDRRYASRVLRAFLHALRDRLTVEEAAQLAAQLPTLIRGVYYENWVPARTPMLYRDVDEFLDRIAEEAQMHGETEASFGCAAAAAVLRNHVSAGELEDVLAVLPKDLRQLVAA